MTSQTGGTGERAHVLWELVQTAHLAERRLTAVFAEHGLTPAQYGVLASLADGDDLSQAELARTVLVRPQSMARLLDAMEDSRLVVRRGQAGRGRRKTLELTVRGRRRFEAARPAVYRLLAPGVTGLDAGRAADLVATLVRVREHLQQAERSGRGTRR